MNAIEPWEVVSSEALQDCRVFRVSRVQTRAPRRRGGGVRDYFRIESQDWVNVIPVTAAGEVVMIRQWRHGARAVTLEIPGGLVDPGETPEQSAARELREETGYAAAGLRPLGQLNPNPALFDNRVHTFLAENCRRVGEVQNSAREETLPVLIPAGEIPERLRRGEIDHAIVVAALHWWQLDKLR